MLQELTIKIIITHLTFGPYYDEKVDNLPYSLTHLTFDECFNQ